ncbi:hypothetical protein BJF83_22955 [Nocardiopsis sp. CNR-923]|uniref:hypothetical protein n=1 Tax=Nocardiopsis sp. CNR-923 TaxID=1904965 RepID=UPI00095EF54D|nr:hypothetical protein [Nocardiopsis sp. CNR-923]OLT25387.1 hypothetical protein BJF83_22955 [Nocardiopsis sp. CNR-923]
MTEAGVDPNEAHEGGTAAANAAALLHDLPEDFDQLVRMTQSIMNAAPGVEGWNAFGGDHEVHMMDVKEHADTLARNIQAGATEGARTDEASSEDFASASSELNRPVNFGPSFIR